MVKQDKLVLYYAQQLHGKIKGEKWYRLLTDHVRCQLDIQAVFFL